MDFAIVGSGAAGGIIAKELATAGYSVVVLEQGPRLTEAQFDSRRVRHSCRTTTSTIRRRSRRRSGSHPQRPHRKGWRSSTGEWSAAATRISPPTSGGSARAISMRRSRLGGVSGASLVDWPITYDELEPYYTKAEWELGVSGEPGPFDPPRSRPYPMPPLPVKSSGVLLERGARALGLHAQASPMAINSQPYNGRPACQHCGFCLFFMCEFRAKSTSMATMLPLAEATGRCEIRPDSYVARVETGPDGRATGVSYFDAAEAAASAARQGRRALRERRRNAAAAAQLRVGRLHERPCQFERPRRQAPDVQHVLRRQRAVRAPAQRVQERSEHAHRVRFLRDGSAPRILRRRRHRCALRDVPDHFSRSAGSRRDLPTWGDGFARGLAEQFTRTMFFATHGTSLPRRIEQRHDRPQPEGCLGAAVHAGHVQRPSGRFEERRVPQFAGAANRAGGWRAQDMVSSQFSRRPSPSICSARAGWGTTRALR